MSTAGNWTQTNLNRVPVVWGTLAIKSAGGCEGVKTRECVHKAFKCRLLVMSGAWEYA